MDKTARTAAISTRLFVVVSDLGTYPEHSMQAASSCNLPSMKSKVAHSNAAQPADPPGFLMQAPSVYATMPRLSKSGKAARTSICCTASFTERHSRDSFSNTNSYTDYLSLERDMVSFTYIKNVSSILRRMRSL